MWPDARSQRRPGTRAHAHRLRREAIKRKHAAISWDDDLIADSFVKENFKQSPVRRALPSFKPSPERNTVKPSPERNTVAVALPASATWGMKSRVAVWVSTRDREVLNEDNSAETLPSQARLPSKSGERADRKDKIKRLSLRRKYWIKTGKARRAARKQHELELERELCGDGDGDGGGGGGDDREAITGKMKPAPRARQSPYWTKRREKERRKERRAARDRKCFDAAFDSVEFEPLVDASPAPKKKKQYRPFVLKPEHVRRLLSSESTGPPVSDLFHTGVVLSNEAVKDLQLMLAGQGVARALANAVSAPALKIRSAKDPRGRSPLSPLKIPPPSKAYPTKPVVLRERGKRRC